MADKGAAQRHQAKVARLTRELEAEEKRRGYSLMYVGCESCGRDMLAKRGDPDDCYCARCINAMHTVHPRSTAHMSE